MNADQALERILELPKIRTVLDIGSGRGEHARIMREHGMIVTTMDSNGAYNADINFRYEDGASFDPFDLIWASHVLEHSDLPAIFLSNCFCDLKDGGILAITVPPMKHELVGGHVTLWNEGILCYNLIKAGFDCSRARVGVYDYNISVIVEKTRDWGLIEATTNLKNDHGDIDALSRWFPWKGVRENVDGRLGSIRW